MDDADKSNAARLMTTVMAVRTKFFDDFFTDAAANGIRQAVILASGLDSRPYRLPWPDGTVVYEIDQPQVVEFKTATMSAIGATPSAERRAVAIDLRHDWPAALRRSGFDDTVPTAWSAEGLLVYLPPEAQDRLFDNIAALSAPGSRLATEFHPDAGASIRERAAALRSEWQEHGFDVNLADLFYPGERNNVVDYLRRARLAGVRAAPTRAVRRVWQGVSRHRRACAVAQFARGHRDTKVGVRHGQEQTTTPGTWRPVSVRRPPPSPPPAPSRPRDPTRFSTTRSPNLWSARSASSRSSGCSTARWLNDDDPLMNRRTMSEQIAVRTRFFDDFFTAASEAGIRQAVILAAGLDTRGYRLPWPSGTVVFEVDQPKVIAFKTATLDGLGAVPKAPRRTVAIDLRDDWPSALRDAGFDPAQATAWIAEGLLVYLPPEAQDRLFDNITALSAPGSRLATEHMDMANMPDDWAEKLDERSRRAGTDLNLSELFYSGERNTAGEYLSSHGWRVATHSTAETFAANGFELPDDELTRLIGDSGYLTATLQEA